MKRALQKLWSNEFSQGGIVLTSGSFIINFLNYLFSLLTAKSLGPSGFGEITAVLSYVIISSVPLTILSTLIIQKISAAGNERKTYALSLERLFLEKTKIISLFFILFLLLTPFLPRFTNLSTAGSYSLFPLILLTFFSVFYISANQGLRIFLIVTIINITTTLFKFLGALFAYLHVGGITVVFIFLIISALISFIANYIFFHRTVHTIRDKIQRIERSITSIIASKDFLMFCLSITGMTFFGTIDILFAKKFFSAETAGIYSSWSLLAKIILYAVGPLISISFIFFSSKETKNQQQRILAASLLILILLGILSYFVYTNFGKELITVFFGNRFNAVMNYLGLASIFGSLYTAIFFINNYFLSQKSLGTLILPIGIPFYILGLFMIPKNIGAIMYLSICFSMIIVGFYGILFFKKWRTNSHIIS